MKDVKIYDGAAWRSLKGPTVVSKDAGNVVSLGTDGFLYAASIVEAGVWTPDGVWPDSVTGYEVFNGFGSYVKVGSIIHATGVLQTNADDRGSLPDTIIGLPYPARSGGGYQYQFGAAYSAPSSPGNSMQGLLYTTSGSDTLNVLGWRDSALGGWIPDNSDIAFQITYITD